MTAMSFIIGRRWRERRDCSKRREGLPENRMDCFAPLRLARWLCRGIVAFSGSLGGRRRLPENLGWRCAVNIAVGQVEQEGLNRADDERQLCVIQPVVQAGVEIKQPASHPCEEECPQPERGGNDQQRQPIQACRPPAGMKSLFGWNGNQHQWRQ